MGQCNGVELYYSQRWVQTKDWRYIFNGFDFDELYENPDYASINPYITVGLAPIGPGG